MDRDGFDEIRGYFAEIDAYAGFIPRPTTDTQNVGRFTLTLGPGTNPHDLIDSLQVGGFLNTSRTPNRRTNLRVDNIKESHIDGRGIGPGHYITLTDLANPHDRE